VRWIVDAMNVIGTRPDGWWKDRRAAMVRLVERIERWAADGGHDVTVVFEKPVSPPIRSSIVTIGHAPKAAPNSADDEIVRLVLAAGLLADDDRPGIAVVTSDSALAERVRDAGATVVAAAGFRDLVDDPADRRR
jgi:predicted RNA-binding protein with PIN domain